MCHTGIATFDVWAPFTALPAHLPPCLTLMYNLTKKQWIYPTAFTALLT
jgi:hypothetical protein